MANNIQKPAAKKAVESPSIRRHPASLDMFDRFFDEDFPTLWSRKLLPFRELMQFESKLPIVDVIERDDEIIVRAEVPGVDKKDLEVTMSDHSLTIKGEKSTVEVDDRDDYYRKEIVEGKFSRTISLPAAAGAEVVSAKFKNGLLEVVVKKSDQEKRRQIKID
ncbi:Hsp20/alpha crystallin family protein [Pseudomonadales bacterium]|nr:Hsp20/alpha crystallin family protein [Pseudomonadales bacterium]